MASNRHLGRIIALQTLYEEGFRKDCGDKKLKLATVLSRNLDRFSKSVEDKDFIKTLVNGINDNKKYLNTVLQPIAPDWPLDQIARMDRIILYIGAYELLFEEVNVPSKVAINESVELAKAFGGENSSKFINGVLGTLIKQKDDGSLKSSKK